MKIDRKYRVPRIAGPARKRDILFRAALLLALLAGAGLLGYQLGLAGLRQQVDSQRQTESRLLAELEQERNALQKRMVMAEQASKMDREALQQVREQIKAMQDERLKMEEELAFLKSIVSTSSRKEGLRVQNFKLEPGLEPGSYRYRFSVSQVLKTGLVAKGRIFISVEGLQDGAAKTLQLVEMTEDKTPSIKMRFRYFQNVEGEITLPEGFEPAKLKVDVKPVGKKLMPVSESYDWAPVS